jgi:hypothetical protein
MHENTATPSQDTVNQNITTRLEALKLIKDWSAGLIVVQSTAIAVVGAFLQTVPSGWRLWLVIALLLSLIISIYIGAVAVIGTIPYITQRLPENPDCDIYTHAGGLKTTHKGLATLSLGQLCLWQARLFTISLVLFAIFAVSRERSTPEPSHVILDRPIQVETMDSSAR